MRNIASFVARPLMLLSITLALVEPSFSASQSQASPNGDAESIQLIIVVASSLIYTGVTGQEYSLSDRLEKAVRDAHVGNARVETPQSPQLDFRVKPPERLVTVSVGKDWLPFVLRKVADNTELRRVEFRRGGFGLRNGDLFVLEGTEARTAGTAYQFHGKKWLPSAR